MITISKLKRHIKKYHKKYHGDYYNLLGLVENQELSPEVKSLFTFYNENGLPVGYDWVNGNDKMRKFVESCIN